MGSRHQKWEKSQWKSNIGCGRALRGKNYNENVRKRGRPKIRWLDRVRGDIKEKGLSGRECTTELHIIEHRLTKSGTQMKRSLTDEDDVP